MATGFTPNERRVFARARVVATATVWVRGLCKGSYIIENLSWGGTYLSGGPAIREGIKVKLVLHLPRGLIEVHGRILRSEALARDASLAVSFDEPTRGARAAIGAAVGEALTRAHEDSSVRPEPTVLIVDDSLLVREALTRDLRCLGWEVAGFSTPLDALTFMDRPASRISVVFIDHTGPSHARDLLAFLADERPAIRRVLMSEAGRRVAEDLAAPGASPHAVLPKPWDQETLTRTLPMAAPGG